LVGKQGGKKPMGWPRRRWEDNIKINLREIGWGSIDWINLTEDRDWWRALVNMVMNIRVPQNVGKSLSSWATDGFSRRAQLHGVGYMYADVWTLPLFAKFWNTNSEQQNMFKDIHILPITEAARSKAWTFLARSNTGVVASNPTRGTHVCVRLFCVCVVMCVGRGLATDWSSVQGVLPTAYRLRNGKSGQGPTKGCRAVIE
jgi:hypothetical protein